MSSSVRLHRFTPRVALVAALAALLSAGSAAASTYTITLDGTPVTAVTTSGGEKATLNFTGTAGHRVSVRVSSSSMTSYTIAVKAPDGTSLKTSGTWGVTGGFIGPISEPTTGTYKIVITPASTIKGTAVVAAWDVPSDLSGSIATDGTLATQTYVAPGQNGKLTFAGTAGQRISFLAGAGSTSARNVSVSIKAPSGASVLASTAVGTGGMFFGPLTLAETGTYVISANPPTYTSGTTEYQLWTVPADQTGTLTMGGGNQVLSFATPGQNANLTFAGTSGQKVTLAISPVSLVGVNGATVKIKKPDGTVLSTIAVTNSGTLLEPTTLPATGTYTVSVDPTGQATGSITLSLFLSPADLSGALSSGTPTTVSLPTIGQNASYTISGTAGQYLALNFTSDSIASLKVTVTTPTSTTLIAATTFTSSGKFFDAVALPSTGSYTVKVDPQGMSTGSVNVTGYVFSNPVTQAATLGTPLTVTTVPGQNAQVTFTAAAKDSIQFSSVTAGSTPISGINATLSTGSTTVKQFSFGNSGTYVDAMSLTAGATYKLALDPQGTNAGSVTVTVYSVPADASYTPTIGGGAQAVTTTVPGQNAKLTFTGTAGHLLSMWINGNTIGSPISFPTAATLTSPTGTTVETFNLYAHDTMIEPVSLPATGTYTLSFNPSSNYTGTFTITLYDVPADATNTATVGGSGVTATTTVPGQNAQISFTTTSATPVTITYDVTSSFAATPISILKNGVVVQTAVNRNPGDSWTFTPAAGTNTYTIKIDPTVNNIGDAVIFVA